jgi:hypothetical protein
VIRYKRLQSWIGLLKETHKSRSWIFWIRMAFFLWGASVGFGNKILLHCFNMIWSQNPFFFFFFLSEVSRHLGLFFITDKIWILMNTSAREVVWWMTIMCTVLISDNLLTSTCHRGLKFIWQVLRPFLVNGFFFFVNFLMVLKWDWRDIK